jgi:hypothetical protein
MINLPRPKISSTDKRLTFTALGAQGTGYDGTSAGMEYSSYGNAPPPQHANATGDTAYYARAWGSHPDMHAFDLKSQASTTLGSVAPSTGKSGGRGGKQGDSRYDNRYQHDAISQDGSVRLE